MGSVVGEAVIGGMTEAAVGSLLSKLSQELYRIHAFHDDVDSLRRQFTILQGFVQSAYYSNRMEGYILKWVEKVEDYVFQAEDVLHDCTCWHLCNDNSASSSSSSSNVLGKVSKSPQNAWHKWKISRRISHLSKELRRMEEMAVQHGLTRQHPPAPLEESEEKTAGILFDEPFTVGLDAKVSEFLSLVEAHARIGVVGMGGVGKTRVLQHAYKEIKSRFELPVWLCISQSYDVKSLQMDILHQISILHDNPALEALSKLTKEGRAQEIHEALKEKACLIVLDDVWSSAPTQMQGSLPDNDLLKALGLPENVNILVSTRRRQVVIDMRAYHYELHRLSQEDSKKLFCLYAFGTPEFHEHQEDRLMKIIEGCHNLPLAVKTTARVLALHYQRNPGRFPLPEEEEESGVQPLASEDLGPVMRCLMWSYNVLPMDLKRCFAYMAVFPEDHKINGSRLVTLWMAEGFVSSRQRGRNVLNSLCDRCLVELLPTEQDDWSWRYPAHYKMHDLIRDLAISIFHKVGGFCKGSEDEFRRALLSRRRVSLFGVSVKGFSDLCGPQLRSLLLDKYDHYHLHNKISRGARGLRVLGIRCVRFCSRKVLSRLVFLELKAFAMNERGRDARSLEYLLFHSEGRLPRWIGELTRLTHLERTLRHGSAVKSLGRLLNLRLLKTVRIDDEFSFRDLSNLQKLNELSCYSRLEPKKMKEWTPPQSMQCLWFANLRHDCDMPESWEAMTDIQCLRLERVTLMAGCQAFQKLMHLVLKNCSSNPPVEIVKLPRLTGLRLESFESCSQLPEEYGMSWAFPSLEHFVIVKFPLLRKLPSVEKGAMTSLRTLMVRVCENFSFNELPPEFFTKLPLFEKVVRGGMWKFEFKESATTTQIPLASYYLDCGRHTLGGLQSDYHDFCIEN